MLREKYIEIGKLHISWGAELQQDDCRFYGVSYTVSLGRWAFFGLSLDSSNRDTRKIREILDQVLQLTSRWQSRLINIKSGNSLIAAVTRECLIELETSLQDPDKRQPETIVTYS